MPVAPLPGPARSSPWIPRAALFALALAATLDALRLGRIVRTEPGLPLWDEAAQGLVGARLLDAVRALRPLEFLAILNDQVVWPPLHGLILVPWMSVAGVDWESAARLNAWLVALLPLLAFAGGGALHPGRGTWAGAFAAALLLSAPHYGLFGTIGMLEVPGACLLALAFVLHAAALRPDAPRGTTAAAGLATAALMLLKYNYGLMALAGILLFEWRERPDAARRGVVAARAWLARGGWRRPMPLFVSLYALGLAAILVTGGGSFTWFGQPVSVRSPGNPAYGLFLVLCGWAAVSFARRRDAWRAWWHGLPGRARVLTATIGVPLLAWFLIPVPNRVRALVEFSINRSSGPAPWSLEGLAYYPQAFVRDYAATPWLGWAVLALALVPPRRRDPPGARLAWCAAVTGLAATALHRYHDPRFLFTTVVPLALSAAARLTGLLAALVARAPARAAAGAWGLALAAALAAPFALAPSESRVRAGHRGLRGPAGLEAPLDFVLERAARGGARAVLLGVCNPMSPALLEWRARARGAPPRDRVPRRSRPADFTTGTRSVVVRPEAPVLAAIPVPGSALDSFTRDELTGDRGAVAELARRGDLETRVDTTFVPPGVRVMEFGPRPAPR